MRMLHACRRGSTLSVSAVTLQGMRSPDSAFFDHAAARAAASPLPPPPGARQAGPASRSSLRRQGTSPAEAIGSSARSPAAVAGAGGGASERGAAALPSPALGGSPGEDERGAHWKVNYLVEEGELLSRRARRSLEGELLSVCLTACGQMTA
jgi:hypothetical protein